jgi:hypothetical protein
MRLLVVKPKPGVRLKAALDSKRKAVQQKGGTFALDKRGKWVHTGYKGWINLKTAPHGLIIARSQTLAPGEEWKILTAFLGFLDRHFKDSIEWVMIAYD